MFLTIVVVLLHTLFYAPADSLESGRVLAVSTNIPYDVTYIPGYGVTSVPSFSLEYYPSGKGRFSFGLDFESPWWAHPGEHRFLQINNLTVNGRWYFQKKYAGDYHGLYALASGGAVRYGIGFNAKGWQGEGFHLSSGIGYKFTLGKSGRFFMDLGLSLGWLHSRYDPFVWGNDSTGRYYYDYSGIPEEFELRNKALDWLGPTRAWISVGVELFKHKAR